MQQVKPRERKKKIQGAVFLECCSFLLANDRSTVISSSRSSFLSPQATTKAQNIHMGHQRWGRDSGLRTRNGTCEVSRWVRWDSLFLQPNRLQRPPQYFLFLHQVSVKLVLQKQQPRASPVWQRLIMISRLYWNLFIYDHLLKTCQTWRVAAGALYF